MGGLAKFNSEFLDEHIIVCGVPKVCPTCGGGGLVFSNCPADDNSAVKCHDCGGTGRSGRQ